MDFMNDIKRFSHTISSVPKRGLQLFRHGRLSPFQIGVMIPGFHTRTYHYLDAFAERLKRLGVFYQITAIAATTKNLEITREESEAFLAYKEYDLIVSHGISCTRIAHDLTVSEEYPRLIFTGVRYQKAVECSFIRSFELQNNYLTGVLLGEFPYNKQFAELDKLGMSFKKVLIVYNSENRFFGPEIKEIEQLCTIRKHALDIFEINAYTDYTRYIGSYLDRSDLVLTLRDSFTTLEIESIAYLCKQHNTTLCTSDWYSLKQGAHMGFGFDEKLIGREAANKAFLMLEKDICPSEISFSTPTYSYSLRLQNQKGKDKKIIL